MAEYPINKGIGRPVEFKGLKAQYLFIFCGGLLALFGSRRGRLLRVVQGPVLPASADGGYQQFLVNAFGVHFPAAHDY